MSEVIGELLGIPIITVSRVHGSVATIYCPLCDEQHKHGTGKEMNRPTEYKQLMARKISIPHHRTADCGEGDYWYVYTEDTRGLVFGEGGLSETHDMEA